MKAILMAAGRGTRISRMIEEVPKSTLPINGVPLITHTVKMLVKMGFDVVVCVGYRQQLIKDALKDYEVKYYYNPFYEVSNSIGSLWLAREELTGEAIMMNADVYFSEDILQMLLEDKRDAVLLADKTRCATGDYFFSTTDTGAIRKYGKDLPLNVRSSEYVGIAKVSKEFMPVFTERLNKLMDESKHQLWWENTLYSLTDDTEHQIYTKDVDGKFWSEVDYFDDYLRILNHLESLKEKPED